MWDFFRDALKLRPSSLPLTSYAGLVLAQQVLRTTGFMDLAAACLPAVRANYAYAAELVLIWIMLLQLVGGRTQADIRKFRQDGLFVGQLVPTDRSLANWLDRLGTPAGMAQLRELQRLLVAWAVSPGSSVLDLDDTQVRTEKAGAQPGVQRGVRLLDRDGVPRRRGRHAGGRPAPGESEPAGGAAGGCAGPAADGGAGSHRTWGQRVLHGEISGRRPAATAGGGGQGTANQVVLAGVSKIAPAAWIRWPDEGKGGYVGEREHVIGATREPCRLVYLCRRDATDRRLGRGGQMLFSLATTVAEPPADVVRLYRQLGEAENRIQQLKSGVADGRLPSGSAESNAAWARISSLSHTLAIMMVRALFPRARHTIETLRWNVLARAGRIVTTGGQWYLDLEPEVLANMARWSDELYRRFGTSELKLNDVRPF